MLQCRLTICAAATAAHSRRLSIASPSCSGQSRSPALPAGEAVRIVRELTPGSDQNRPVLGVSPSRIACNGSGFSHWRPDAKSLIYLHELQIARDEDLIWTSVSQRAMKDLVFARSPPIRLACNLLAQQAQAKAQQGQRSEVVETNAICSLEARDKVSLLKLASTCESCLHSLDYLDQQRLTVDEKQAIQDRLARHGFAALCRAVDLGVKDLSYPPFHSFWFLGQQPGYWRLEAKLGLPPSPIAGGR
jgi:hypothetical protein